MLFVEFHGTEPASPSSRSASARSRRARRRPVRLGDHGRRTARLWQARHDAYWAGRGLRPGAQALATDVCVPISRLAECVTETQARHRRERSDRADRRPCRRRQFPSHAAGRHGRIRPRSRAPRTFCERLVERALAMDGTCTGEHGVGQGKMKYLAGRARRAGARRHARDQARARPAGHHEPRQDRGLSARRGHFARS